MFSIVFTLLKALETWSAIITISQTIISTLMYHIIIIYATGKLASELILTIPIYGEK